MARSRVSTTVDEGLLSAARALRVGLGDAALLDEALPALIARHRAAEIDAAYSAYDEHPLDEPDAWGLFASFGRAAAWSSRSFPRARERSGGASFPTWVGARSWCFPATRRLRGSGARPSRMYDNDPRACQRGAVGAGRRSDCAPVGREPRLDRERRGRRADSPPGPPRRRANGQGLRRSRGRGGLLVADRLRAALPPATCSLMQQGGRRSKPR